MNSYVDVISELAFISAILTVALQQIFDTDIYRSFTKKISKLCPNYFSVKNNDDSTKDRDLRPWISSLIGIYIACAFNIQALHSGLNVQNPGQVNFFPEWIDLIFTGIIIGGGTKTIKNLANSFFPNDKKT